jgi:4'-phosphopantetheinyl transferase
MLRVFGSREKEAHELLLFALREVYGLSKLPEIARMPKGKPWFPSAPEIHFNLSHSNSLTLCAVGDGEVGADIEEIRPRRPALPGYALTPGELEEYTRRGATWEAFFVLWTRKEAWSKFTGEGLGGRPSGVVIPEGALLRGYAGGGWRGAVCATEYPPELSWID